jgi:hypothetical protein
LALDHEEFRAAGQTHRSATRREWHNLTSLSVCGGQRFRGEYRHRCTVAFNPPSPASHTDHFAATLLAGISLSDLVAGWCQGRASRTQAKDPFQVMQCG